MVDIRRHHPLSWRMQSRKGRGKKGSWMRLCCVETLSVVKFIVQKILLLSTLCTHTRRFLMMREFSFLSPSTCVGAGLCMCCMKNITLCSISL